MDKWLSNVNVVRIAALISAILLWAVVHLGEQNTSAPPAPTVETMSISDVKITEVNVDSSQYYIRSISRSFVNVYLTGRQSNLNKVNPAHYQIQMDLSGVKEGEHQVPLRAIGFPQGVEVQISPAYVNVTIEKMQKKEVPVTVRLTGAPEKGFIAGEPIVKPSRVNITMPVSQINQVDTVGVELNIDKANDVIKKEVTLHAYNQKGEELDVIITPSVVQVEVPITSPLKKMPLRIRLLGQVPKGYGIASYVQGVHEVTVFGEEEAVKALDFYDGIEINLAKLTEDTMYSLKIPLKPQIHRIDPEVVEVRIDIEPSVSKVLEGVPITISGQNNDYITKIINPEAGRLDIPIEGAPNIIGTLTANDIQVIVNVGNLAPGLYELPVSLNLPLFVKKGFQENPKVQVEISENIGEAVDPGGSEGTVAEEVTVEAEAGSEEQSTTGRGITE
jgi:YbbR domain-containing protein